METHPQLPPAKQSPPEYAPVAYGSALRGMMFAFVGLMTIYGFIEWTVLGQYSGLAEFLAGVIAMVLLDISISVATIKYRG